jgi:Transcriptional regulation of mitochondrial recombination
MEVLSQSAKRFPRFALHGVNRAPQTRPYTKETLNKLRRRRAAGKPSRTPRTATVPSPNSKRPRVSNVESHGKLRNPSSNAAKAERFKESRRVEKALKHEHHGENVYAYVHIRTGQVVYSLTRIMNVCACY